MAAFQNEAGAGVEGVAESAAELQFGFPVTLLHGIRQARAAPELRCALHIRQCYDPPFCERHQWGYETRWPFRFTSLFAILFL